MGRMVLIDKSTRGMVVIFTLSQVAVLICGFRIPTGDRNPGIEVRVWVADPNNL